MLNLLDHFSSLSLVSSIQIQIIYQIDLTMGHIIRAVPKNNVNIYFTLSYKHLPSPVPYSFLNINGTTIPINNHS